MRLKVERYQTSPGHATLGTLSVDGKFFCYSLEDEVRERDDCPVSEWKIKDQTAIPRGTYDVVLDFSPHFGRVLPHVLDVTCYIGVRIHPGNTTADTSGCILVGGKPTSPDFLPNSRMWFNKLFALLEAAEAKGDKITLEII